MPALIETLRIECPTSDASGGSRHGIQDASPCGFRGIRLACGCEFLVTEQNTGWIAKPKPERRVEAKP